MFGHREAVDVCDKETLMFLCVQVGDVADGGAADGDAADAGDEDKEKAVVNAEAKNILKELKEQQHEQKMLIEEQKQIIEDLKQHQKDAHVSLISM